MNKLTILGLGYGDPGAITSAAWQALRNSGLVLVRTGRHPSVPALEAAGISFRTLDHCYEQEQNFQSVYERICTEVTDCLHNEDVVYAVPGDPGLGETSVGMLRTRLKQAGNKIIFIPGISFVEPVLSALDYTLASGLQVLDALVMDLPNPRLPLLVYQVFNRRVASELKLSLANIYPDEHMVNVISAAGLVTERREEVPLWQLDHLDWLDHLTTVFVPPLTVCQASGHVIALTDLLAYLRSAQGCSWDKAQTHQSLIPYVLEEAYELVSALAEDDENKICEELGDLLLQIIFHSQIGAENGGFAFPDVVKSLCEKLIRRHPHIFAGKDAHNTEEVTKLWQEIKAQERCREQEHPRFPGLLALQKSLSRGNQIPDSVQSDPLLKSLLALVTKANEQGRCLETEAVSAAKLSEE